MAKANFFPFFYRDFLHGTRYFARDTIGTYMLLLCEQWDECFVEAGIYNELCSVLSDTEKEKLSRKFLSVKIKSVDGFQNKRMEETRKSVTKRSKIAITNGSLGGRPKKNQNETQPETQAKPKKNLPNPNPNPNPNSNPKGKSTHTERPGARGILRSWPEGFELTEPMIDYAKKKNVKDPADEFQAFKNWSDQLEKKFKDWEAAWRTRCDNYLVFSGDKKTTEGGYG